MKMHENNKRNAMLTEKGKKRGKGIKLQQRGVQQKIKMKKDRRRALGLGELVLGRFGSNPGSGFRLL